MIPVYALSIPEYTVDRMPWDSVGDKIDAEIRAHYGGRKIVLRALGSMEHPDKTVDDLIEIIRRLGHDRYDPNREGDRYKNIQGKHIDFFGLPLLVGKRNSLSQLIINSFYEWPPKFGRPPIKCDLFLVYDRAKVRQVSHRYEGRTDIKKDGFVFKDPENKPDALLGIVKIE